MLQLPSKLCNGPLGICADEVLAPLVKQQNEHAKGERKKVVLDGDLGGTEHGLEDGDVQPKDGHEQREDDGGEQPQVLGEPVKGGRVLEDAPAAGAHGHEVEPLHDDQVDEVDRRRLVELLRVVVRIDAVGHRAEAEPQRAERDAAALEVPVRHGEGGDGLQDAQHAVRVQDQLPVDQAVLLDVAGLAEEDVGFGLFV